MDHASLKDATLIVAVLSWAALLALLAGLGRFRLDGAADRALAFLVAAALTRLAFTHVQTRWQIAAFVLVATLAAAVQPSQGALAAAARWAASVAGTAVGAIAMREVVHHYLERWL